MSEHVKGRPYRSPLRAERDSLIEKIRVELEQFVFETIDGKDTLTRVGVTCALCHSTVDNSFAPGIGKRLDGWPNRDLNVGAIIALSPALSATQKAVYNSWGKGKYDPRYNQDQRNGPQVIPPAYGLAGVHRRRFRRGHFRNGAADSGRRPARPVRAAAPDGGVGECAWRLPDRDRARFPVHRRRMA